MTGMAAIAFCAAFTSCSKEITPMTQEEKAAIAVEKIYSNYEAAFQKVFGTPAAGHTWGFSDAASTRSVDVNGNLWESCPSLETGEAQAVYNWVNKPKNQIPPESYSEVSPVDLKNFFVTQVWGKNENTNDANCHYTDYDGSGVFGSDKMNHLQISKSATRLGTDGVKSMNATWDHPGGDAINADWDHANNFNAASNQDWNGNTMFVNWGTQNFAYHDSYDSRYHDKWIIVNGYYITEDHRFADKYYVCFDFISRNPDAYTNFQDANGQNYEVFGAWKSTADAVAAGAKVRIYKGWDSANNKGIYEEGQTVGSNWTKGNVVGGNMVVDANEYYTDWIIRLVEAQPKTEPANFRVLAEDLSAGEDGKDFDFNDVVFDVYYGDASTAKVTILAAGGLLPLKVNGVDVHSLLGHSGKMINTKGTLSNDATVRSLSVDNVPTKDILLGFAVNSADQVRDLIKIEVYKEQDGIEQWVELKNTGRAACKVGVDPSKHKNFANERQSVNDVIFGWNEWVVNGGNL